MQNYLRFAAMILTATIVMYGLMYLNTYQSGHIAFSETRVYMAFIMGACMAAIMLTFMLGMYENRKVNLGIYLGSAVIFALSLWLVRSQATIGDVSYMRAMIPHHSIAILTSERANIEDERVRRLADEIIAAQRREIAEMKVLIEDIENGGKHTKSGVAQTATQMLLGPKVPQADASQVQVPDGFRAEVVVKGLTYPTSVEFDDAGTMYIAEAGYSYGDEMPPPRILRVASEGDLQVVVEGEPLLGPINDLLWHNGRMYISHRGKISMLESDGEMRDIVTGLPSDGDHHNNQMTVGPDGKIYFGQGTVTNSGVVGEDNFKMGWLKDHPNLHDIPAHDIALTGRTFESPNPLNTRGEKVHTSAFHPFAEAEPQGSTVPRKVNASGTILRMQPDGSQLEVYAWGLRNPYGVMWSPPPDNTLYATENGCDARGSRPIANDQEDIYTVKEGAWYGWPDYAMGIPVTDPRFRPKGKSQPQFVMAEHPPVEQPWLNFPKHSAIAKIEFSRAEPFGDGHMFVAFFGHMSPMTGEAPKEHGGHRVVRIDPATRSVETFFSSKHGHGGQHQDQGQGEHRYRDSGGQTQETSSSVTTHESISAGPRRLLDVRFGPDGRALYIADFGTMIVEDKPRPVPGTGVIWRVVTDDQSLNAR